MSVLVFYVHEMDEDGLPYYSAFIRSHHMPNPQGDVELCVYARPPDQTWISFDVEYSDTTPEFASAAFVENSEALLNGGEVSEEEWDEMDVHEQCFMNSVFGQVHAEGWDSVPTELESYFTSLIQDE